MSQPPRMESAFDRTLFSTPPSEPHAQAPQQPADPLIGLVLQDTYRVQRSFGEGGMGQVYEAEHLRIDRRFAIKIIHLPLSVHGEMRARFEREARVMSRVRSDHVVDVVDVISAPDGRPCIVTELLEGEDLELYTLKKGGKLSPHEAVSLVRQGLRGLSAAHALGVVHRDIKPENMFLARGSNGDVTVKLLDFGVAKMGGDPELTAAGVVVGTPAYMSPEQARGSAQADVRSDIYAVGAVLYRLLTSQCPFEGSDAQATLIRLMEESPQRPSQIERSIPSGLEAVIETAMARDPGQRYQNVAELDRALAAFDHPDVRSQGQTLSSSQEGSDADAEALDRRARWARPRAIALAASSAVLAGMALSAWLAMVVALFTKGAELRTPELVLIGLFGVIAVGLLLTFTIGNVRKHYRNIAMIEAASARVTRSIVVGCAALGALELIAILWATYGALRPDTTSPGWAAVRIAVALGASVIGYRGLRAKA